MARSASCRNWSTTYNQWLEHPGLVRQPPALVGTQIPAWYDEAANVFVGEDEPTRSHMPK